MRPVKRSFSIRGHKTSISLEAAFWEALKVAAHEDGITLSALVAAVDRERGEAGLSSAVRVWLLRRLQKRAGVPQRLGGDVAAMIPISDASAFESSVSEASELAGESDVGLDGDDTGEQTPPRTNPISSPHG